MIDTKFKSLRTSVLAQSKGSLSPLSSWLYTNAEGRVKIQKEMYFLQVLSRFPTFHKPDVWHFLFNNPKCLSLQGSCTGSLSAHANFSHPQYSFAGSSVANRTVVFFLSLGLASFVWCPLALMLEDRAYNFYPSFQRHSLICWPLSCITCPGCLFSRLASLSLLSCPFKCIQWWLSCFFTSGDLDRRFCSKLVSLCVHVQVYMFI